MFMSLQDYATLLQLSFRDVAAFRYLGMSVRNANGIREEITAEYVSLIFVNIRFRFFSLCCLNSRRLKCANP
jgi:hypothetical protein